MSRAIYFDCFSGISGDMAVAALIDIGADTEKIKKGLKSLHFGAAFKMKVKKVSKGGISASKVDFTFKSQLKTKRTLKEIFKIINSGTLSKTAVERASLIFKTLAEAEAAVHRTSINKVHLHEVGSFDSICDIVSVCIGLEDIGITQVYSSPLPFFKGFVKSEHGILPLPAPAAAYMIQGLDIFMTELDFELVTPTGAAIIKALAKPLKDIGSFQIDKIGYGAGTYDLPDRANVLRTFLFSNEIYDTDNVLVCETNLDDESPEIISYAVEKLLNEGALDAFITPVIMKKGRNGSKITFLSKEADFKKLADILFLETSSIGIRYYRTNRIKLKRKKIKVETNFGDIFVKETQLSEKEFKYKPEFEDLKKAAEKNKTSIKKIYNSAMKGVLK